MNKKKLRRFFLSIFLLFFHQALAAEQRWQINLETLEQQIHQQINQIRRSHHLPSLAYDRQLAAIARGHSQDMAEQHFFSHINLQGETPSDRSQRQGWIWQKRLDAETSQTGIAENLFLTHLYDRIISRFEDGYQIAKDFEWQSQNRMISGIVQGWMKSPAHRENLLSPNYDREGIGVAISGNEVYVTEDLF